MLRHLLFVLILLGLLGCTTPDNNSNKTLTLTLVSRDNTFSITDYKVSDNTYKKPQQQGLYQVHLLDKRDRILQKISFERLEIPASNTESGNGAARFFVSVPLKPNLEQVVFYQLDGSSGHYTLKDNDPLLKWTLPEEVKHQRTDKRR